MAKNLKISKKNFQKKTALKNHQLVQQKVMSQFLEPTIVQSPNDFSQTVRILMPKQWCYTFLRVRFNTKKKARKSWKENLPAMPGITKMHVATHDPKMSRLQLQKKYIEY